MACTPSKIGAGVKNFRKKSVGESKKTLNLEGGSVIEEGNFSRFSNFSNMLYKGSICTKELIRCIRITH